MMKRILSLFLVVALIVVLAVPVSAAGNDFTWIELLETATVDDSGSNLYHLSGASGFFRIKTPQHMRCTNVDVIITHPSGYSPKFLKVVYNGGYYTLTKVTLDNNTTRFYGANIPDSLYADLVFQIAQNGTGSVNYQILSCKVTPLNNTSFVASAIANIGGTQYQVPFASEFSATVGGDFWQAHQFFVEVSDWRKYDRVIISGSVGSYALNSIRANLGDIGIPYELNYAVSNSSGSEGNAYTWNEMTYYSYDSSYKGSGETDIFTYSTYTGKVLFSVTLDLTGLDRSSTSSLYCFFSGLANPIHGYSIQILNVMGEIDVADTSDSSWWYQFTNFMSSQFTTLQTMITNGFTNVGSWIVSQTDTLIMYLTGLRSEVSAGFANVGKWFEQYFTVKDQKPLDDLGQSSDSISQGVSDIGSFEQNQQAVLNSGFSVILTGISFTSFNAALLFVQKYTNMTFNGISQYAIIFTLPLFLGLFFYLCSRIPGITRWKSRPPSSKGGEQP